MGGAERLQELFSESFDVEEGVSVLFP